MDASKEPSADHRQVSKDLFSLFNALQLEGFTTSQALAIVGQTISAAFLANSKKEEE